MQVFKDSEGEEWTLAITVAGLKRVRAKHHIDLLKVSQGETPLGEQLGMDHLLLADVIFTLLEPEANTREVSAEEFAIRLGGAALGAAMGAFWQELTDFFQQLEAALPKPTTDPKSSPGNASTDSPESSESTRAPSP
jgi:hypothetical protein